MLATHLLPSLFTQLDTLSKFWFGLQYNVCASLPSGSCADTDAAPTAARARESFIVRFLRRSRRSSNVAKADGAQPRSATGPQLNTPFPPGKGAQPQQNRHTRACRSQPPVRRPATNYARPGCTQPTERRGGAIGLLGKSRPIYGCALRRSGPFCFKAQSYHRASARDRAALERLDTTPRGRSMQLGGSQATKLHFTV